MNAYYRLYILSILRLAATLVIKSAHTARIMNQRLIALKKAVDQDDPYTWKYYMNLAGQYHPTNQMMRIMSLDNDATIDFTIESLALHAETRKQYVYGTRYYRDLVAAYPDQELLIKGIINPVDMDIAISANDHSILKYDESLVEPAEQELIPDLQRYINLFFGRYNNSDYGLFEPYFYLGLFGTLSTKLPQKIINHRKDACHTDQAHSYHIRQHLLSTNRAVGLEFDLLTQKQKLFLYRNIRYLNRNIGRQEVFRWVTGKILTDRGFSLAGYRLGQGYKDLIKNLDPEIFLDRITLNGIPPAQGGNRKTVGEVLDLQLPVARDNIVVRDVAEDATTAVMRRSLFNDLKTKALESNVVDRSDAEPFTLTEVLLNHWIYLSHFGRYTAVVPFTNPANGDQYRLNVKDAFIFYLYAYNKAIDIELTHVPVIGARRVRRIPLPTKKELMDSSWRKKVPEYYIDYILKTQVQIGSYLSIESFRNACTEIQKVMLGHRDMRHYAGDYKTEGGLHTIIDRCYMDIRIDLAGGMKYDDWLASKGISVSSMGNIEFDTIAQSIFKTAIGDNLTNATRTREIHAAMLRIMGALSSYSVQFIAQINDSPIKIIDGKFPKLSIPKVEADVEIDIETPVPYIRDIFLQAYEKIGIPVWTPQVGMKVEQQTTRIKVDAWVDVKLKSIDSVSSAMKVVPPVAKLVQPPAFDISGLVQQSVTGYAIIPPQDLGDLFTGNIVGGYEALTPARKAAMFSI